MDERCPRKLKSYPSCACPSGREAVSLSRKGKQGGCPWFVSDAASNYCFFKMMADDGKPIIPQRIAQLLMVDDNEVKKIVTNFRRTVSERQSELESQKNNEGL